MNYEGVSGIVYFFFGMFIASGSGVVLFDSQGIGFLAVVCFCSGMLGFCFMIFDLVNRQRLFNWGIMIDEAMDYGCSFLSKEHKRFFLKLQLEQAKGEYCALGNILGVYSGFKIIELRKRLSELEREELK